MEGSDELSSLEILALDNNLFGDTSPNRQYPKRVPDFVIERELDEHPSRNDKTFLPSEYKKLRRQGYRPEDIDYDMCHTFR